MVISKVQAVFQDADFVLSIYLGFIPTEGFKRQGILPPQSKKPRNQGEGVPGQDTLACPRYTLGRAFPPREEGRASQY
ncbi:MAG: hypothetical protein QNI91_06210 [Arenicellales bacterium]|nr:hypothetical protein [Arenicellales bacterium]